MVDCMYVFYLFFLFFFFFKQKTAYELRISDWSSDVCSSDPASPASPVMAWAAVVIGSSRWGWWLLSRGRGVWRVGRACRAFRVGGSRGGWGCGRGGSRSIWGGGCRGRSAVSRRGTGGVRSVRSRWPGEYIKKQKNKQMHNYTNS